MSLLDRLEAGFDRAVSAARRRSRVFDHVWRAQQRYFDVDAARLAAATAYYGFFAVFAMVVVAFFVLGRFLGDNKLVVDRVQVYLQANLPQLHSDEIFAGSQQIGIIALVGLIIAGVGWVENLRASQRALWHLQEHPGNPIVRWLVDLAVLVALGLLLLISIGIFAGVQELLYWLAGDIEQDPVRVALRGTSTLLSGIADLILGAALLAGVPRLRMSPRRLWPSALLFAVGLGLLKTVGKLYITRTEHNPAYQLVAGTIGLLLYMYLLHQLLLFSASLAATSPHGRVSDLAGGAPRSDVKAALRAAELVEEAAETTERAAQIISSGGSTPAGTLRPVMMGAVGALVTLDLPADAPALTLPWIITFGPLDDDEEWEPVVCGPYERAHALALAEAVVADQDLMAVVEPLQPHVTVELIQGDIEASRLAAENEDLETAALDAELADYDHDDHDDDHDHDHDQDEDEDDDHAHEPPSIDEIRAGFARIAAKLMSS